MRVSHKIHSDEQIVALYSSGTSMPDLAAQFGVSKQRVHQIIRRLGGADADTARAVRRELRDWLRRLHDETQITTVSFGEERPAVEGDDETAWAKAA